jgi:hypothetical protein
MVELSRHNSKDIDRALHLRPRIRDRFGLFTRERFGEFIIPGGESFESISKKAMPFRPES